MTNRQTHKFLIAALDFCAADELCRKTHKQRGTVERAEALRARASAKERMTRAAGRHRPQLELDIREAFR